MSIKADPEPILIYNHRLGDCSRFNNDALVWIPKNASSTLRFLFTDKKHNFLNFDVETYWVFLRDPIERWKSGVIEYIYRNPEKHEWVLDNIDKIVFDEHTTPQTSFLKFIGRTRYVDIHDQKWVTNLLSETSRRSNNKLNNSVVMINTTSHNVDKNGIKKSIDDVYSTQLLNRLKEYYSADIKLLEQIRT